ncbi:MAG: hypothetical protein ABI548_29665 [Polyangiaceae bacterium]
MTPFRVLTRCLLAFLCAAALASCSGNDKGEVVVVVTTDMSLPTDLNWLDWSVAPVSNPEHIEQDSLPLDRFDTLPATLAIVSGGHGAESVLVKLDGRTGGNGGPVRVHREALLTIPDHGVKMLHMPLNWLCSDATLKAPCSDGFTCQAGQCVSSHITLPLPDYVPFDKSSCFDVRACTPVSGWTRALPMIDPTSGDCIMDPITLTETTAVNVALVVNTALVGNAGVCAATGDSSTGAEGDCFVPLNQDDTPDGWRLESNAQGQEVVRLPSTVCQASTHGSVKAVAVTPTGDCRVKSQGNPLCSTPSVCLASSAHSADDRPVHTICPSTFPADSWAGYSCSGSTQPTQADLPGLVSCYIADGDPVVVPVARGHFCCTTGQAPSKDPLLIDDMSGGPTIKLAPPSGADPGAWFTASGDTSSPLSPPQTPQTLFTYQPIVPAVTPTGGPTIRSAACFGMSKGFTGYVALEGFNFAYQAGALGQPRPRNVGQYTGMTFWAKLTSFDPSVPQIMRVEFANADTDDQHSSTCFEAGPDKSTLCDNFGKILTGLGDSWQNFSVKWNDPQDPNDDVTQSATDYGQIRFTRFNTNVYAVNFKALGPGPDGRTLPFEFCVSQISFTQ